MNETEEALAVEQEISRLIAGGGALADYDDAEALRELQALTAASSAAAPVPATGAAASRPPTRRRRLLATSCCPEHGTGE